jgi:large subunit ribosomal protein L14
MVKEAISNMPLKKSEVIRAIVVCTYKKFKRKNGKSVQFDDNVVVVINQKGNPKGIRVLVQLFKNYEDSILPK